MTHIFLTSALVGGEWSNSRPGCFIPRERAPIAHWIGGWVALIQISNLIPIFLSDFSWFSSVSPGKFLDKTLIGRDSLI
jgi:hypothetical protein